jgi:hypothetical protein
MPIRLPSKKTARYCWFKRPLYIELYKNVMDKDKAENYSNGNNDNDNIDNDDFRDNNSSNSNKGNKACRYIG